jgi:DNA-binding NarL/FixJ family response regulator
MSREEDFREARGGEMIRVLLVDDRVDFRLAMASLLDGQPDIEVVAQAGSLAEARGKLGGVDVALLDRGLPDGDGLELVSELREANPDARAFVISSTAETVHPTDAIEAGADGIIDKMDTPREKFAAIRG